MEPKNLEIMNQLAQQTIYLMGICFILGSLFTIFILIVLDVMRLRRGNKDNTDNYTDAP